MPKTAVPQYCNNCQFMENKSDPDPYDSFRSTDHKMVCTKEEETTILGHIELSNPVIPSPDWCPLRRHQEMEKLEEKKMTPKNNCMTCEHHRSGNSDYNEIINEFYYKHYCSKGRGEKPDRFIGKLNIKNSQLNPPDWCPINNPVKRELLEDLDVLKDLFKEFPEATFFIVVRNGNILNSMKTFGIEISCTKDKIDRAYLYRADIRPFLPETVLEKFRGKDMVTFNEFQDVGQEIANGMQREVCLIHMYGSGKPEEASYDDYPFHPQKI